MVNAQTVTFKNHHNGLKLVGIVYTPETLDLTGETPAIVVTGPMLSIKEQAQSVYAQNLAEAGYVTLVFDGSYFGQSEGKPRGLELPSVKETDIEGAVDFLCSLPYVDADRIGGLGICGSGSYMSVAVVKEPRLKAITAVVPAIADITKSPMMGFFLPKEEVIANEKAWKEGKADIKYLNLMPRNFEEGAQYYFTKRGNRPRWSNLSPCWSELELEQYNVPEIMKDMKKPYLVITGENAWSRPASTEVFDAVPGMNKAMHVISEAGHFDLYDLYPYVQEAFDFILPFFQKNI